MSEFQQRSLAIAERRAVAAERQAAAIEKIATAVEDEEGWLVRAILEFATVEKNKDS